MCACVSLAGAVAPRAEARARVGFGPGGLAVRWRSFVQVAGLPSLIGLTTTVQNNWVEAAGAVLHCIRPMKLDPSGQFCYDLLTQACALIQRQNSPINTNKKISPTKFTFSPISSLVRQVGSLFRQVGSLIRQSLRSQVSGSPLESRPSDRTASFCLRNLKLLSLSASEPGRDPCLCT